jgi:hypothetical protein
MGVQPFAIHSRYPALPQSLHGLGKRKQPVLKNPPFFVANSPHARARVRER